MPDAIQLHQITRRCGGCTLCCKLLPIKGIGKPANTRCRHQSSKGCAVYHKPGFPAECAMWSCRWLVDPAAAKLHRPDRTHYVVDLLPDLVRAQNKETGEVTEIPMIQVWVDPSFPEAWQDPALLDYAERAQNGLLLRFSPQRALCLFPPSIATDGQWHQVSDATVVASPSGSLFLDRLRQQQQAHA